MEEKIITVFSMSWAPAISMTVVILSVMVSGICWLVRRLDQQGSRTDKLYEMFVDLLKERK